MSEFKLDTSGVVLKRVADIPGIAAAQFHSIHWTDLDPFPQGFVEALLRSFHEATGSTPITEMGFSDLSPEALALILKDCAAFVSDPRSQPGLNANNGALFWKCRQLGAGAEDGFPPLTVSLGDDGKVYLK